MKKPRSFAALALVALFAALIQLLAAAPAGARISVEPASFVFSSVAYSVGEAEGPATITINRTGSTAGAATVRFATAHGTATAGSDYTEVSQLVSFSPGESSKTVTVPIFNDVIAEGDETVQLALAGPSTGTMLAYPSTATLTILDDEKAFAFAWASYFVAEGDGAALIEIDRIGSSSGTDSVRFATADGTAKAGLDYVATSQLVSFAPGESVKMISVPILNDSLVQGSEVVRLTLSDPSLGTTLITPSSASLTIDDDDSVPVAKPKPSGRIATARLTKKSFTSVQAAVVKLLCSVAPKSGRFDYRLSVLRRSAWRTVRNVSKKGVFFGSYKLTIKQLFGSKTVVSGKYRLKLTADKNSKLLSFTVR